MIQVKFGNCRLIIIMSKSSRFSNEKHLEIRNYDIIFVNFFFFCFRHMYFKKLSSTFCNNWIDNFDVIFYFHNLAKRHCYRSKAQLYVTVTLSWRKQKLEKKKKEVRWTYHWNVLVIRVSKSSARIYCVLSGR